MITVWQWVSFGSACSIIAACGYVVGRSLAHLTKTEGWKDFLKGAGSIFDFPGIYDHELPCKTDAEALRGDWEAVGKDMQKGLDALKNHRAQG